MKRVLPRTDLSEIKLDKDPESMLEPADDVTYLYN